jgi:hypothetical protein
MVTSNQSAGEDLFISPVKRRPLAMSVNSRPKVRAKVRMMNQRTDLIFIFCLLLISMAKAFTPAGGG